MADLVTKQDVVLAVANILMRLGKNDFRGASFAFDRARALFDSWLRERPEKAVFEHERIESDGSPNVRL